jgi:hypothetical protein
MTSSSQGLTCRDVAEILDRVAPRNLPDFAPVANEAAELQPRNSNMRRVPAPILRHQLRDSDTMVHRRFDVPSFDVVGAPTDAVETADGAR